MLDFDTRDITKANLDKSDYEYLSKERSREKTMSESKMYGTSRTSFQNIGNARMVVKHSAPVNQELASGRSQKIHSIYVENEQGERFKYPFKHLNGARAVARHVAEGGNLYDDIGQHIVGLSEELNKLRKFKTYMNRSTVMAEGLSGYMDVVFDRIATVKKTIESLQKENSYKQFVETFEPKDSVEVPEDIQSDWIDQLTIRQFNEELKDVFPYVYKLVSEANAVQELGPEDLIAEDEEVDESGLQYYTGVKKHGKEYMKKAAKAGREGASQEELGRLKDKYSKAAKTKEEIELEAAFEATLGQFSDHVCEECGNPSWTTLEMTEEEIEEACSSMKKKKKNESDVEEGERHGNSKIYDKCWKGYRKVPGKKSGEAGSCKKVESEDNVQEAIIKTAKDASDALGVLRGKGKKIETGDGEYEGNLANEYASEVWDVYSWIESKTNGFQGIDPKFQSAIDDMMTLRGEAKKLETKPGSGKNGKFGNQIVNTLYPVMQYIDAHDFNQEEGNAYSGAVAKAKKDGKKKGDKIDGPDGDEITLEKEQKTPLGEFILSYFDRETGQFPKGETAVLTMIEKDYGEKFIEPAKQFIEAINDKIAEVQGYKETDMDEGLPDDGGLGVLEKLLQGITKDFVNGDDSAAQEMVDMLKKYKAPMDKVADMLEQQAKKLTKKTFSIFDNPLKKTPASNAADRMVTLADYIRSKANESSDLERIRGLAGL